jgi:hypothetical protein
MNQGNRAWDSNQRVDPRMSLWEDLILWRETPRRLKENSFIARRQSEGLTNGTINPELAALKRMFGLASQQTPPLVATTPHIPPFTRKQRAAVLY